MCSQAAKPPSLSVAQPVTDLAAVAKERVEQPLDVLADAKRRLGALALARLGDRGCLPLGLLAKLRGRMLHFGGEPAPDLVTGELAQPLLGGAGGGEKPHLGR